MNLLIDSFWRAAAYCLHPRVIVLSLMPLVLMAVVALGFGYFLWDPALLWVRAVVDSQGWLASVLGWFDSIGMGGLRDLLAPLLIVFVAMPLIVIVSLLVVAAMMTPSMLNLVAERRFPALERRHGGSATAGVFASLGATLVALFALVLSVPLWFVPPMVLILPPLIWGWLTYKVMSYDVLAEHATKEERREIVRRYRSVLLGMGVLTGYMGAAPSLLWASGVLFLALAPVLLPLAIWIYTLVFAFSALWFSHYALCALQTLRAERAASSGQPASPLASIPIDPMATAGLLPPH
jgi:hypothetical protein